MSQWVISAFAISGAFFLCGFGGALIADLTGLWDKPLAGFFAAFGVVSIAYLSAPSKNREFSLLVFIVGCLCAWFLVGSSWYPESYPSKAYQPTHLPFIVTVLGGLVSLAICLFPLRRRKE